MGSIDIALAILGLVAPLLALPYAVGNRRLVRQAAVGALFIVPLFADLLYLAWHWEGGRSVLVPGPFWLAVLMYYPLAVIWSGFWAALVAAIVVRATVGSDSKSAGAAGAAKAPRG